MKMLLYCTKSKPYLYRISDITSCAWFTSHEKINNENGFNGKIVGECELKTLPFELSKNVDDNNKTFFEFLVMKHSCLTYQELKDYLQGKCGYAIYIKNLKIYDEPKELSDYYTRITDKDRMNDYKGIDVIFPFVRIDDFLSEMKSCKKLEKAPQNMQKVVLFNEETNEYEYATLISIRPQWLCKILNGEKTIEVRRKVLKEMM